MVTVNQHTPIFILFGEKQSEVLHHEIFLTLQPQKEHENLLKRICSRQIRRLDGDRQMKSVISPVIKLKNNISLYSYPGGA